jgi:adenosylhomocysteine nucleosidase
MSGPARPSGVGGMRIGLLYALPLERAALAGLDLGPAFLEQAGVGATRARSGAERALSAGADALASVGFCGAARSELVPGDVVVATEVLDASSGRAIRCDPELGALVRGAHGQLETRSGIARTPDERAGSAIALDMESAAIGEVAAEANVPFAAIRAISDSTPTRIPRAIDDGGGLDARALRAADLPHMLRLAVGAGRASIALRSAVRQLVRALR